MVDFEQPSGSLTIESGADDTVDIGAGWAFEDTEVVDGKFARILTKDDLTLRMIGPRDWQNPINRFDVNANGSVEPLDVLNIINELNNPRFRDSVGRLVDAASLAVFPNFFFDVNADGFAVPLDALIIVNFLNLTSQPEGEAAPSPPADHLARVFAEPVRVEPHFER